MLSEMVASESEYIRYRTDGTLFNLRRFQVKNKDMMDVIRGFLFAEVCVLNTVSEVDMHCSVDKLSTTCTNFDLIVSTKKTIATLACPRETVR